MAKLPLGSIFDISQTKKEKTKTICIKKVITRRKHIDVSFEASWRQYIITRGI